MTDHFSVTADRTNTASLAGGSWSCHLVARTTIRAFLHVAHSRVYSIQCRPLGPEKVCCQNGLVMVCIQLLPAATKTNSTGSGFFEPGHGSRPR